MPRARRAAIDEFNLPDGSTDAGTDPAPKEPAAPAAPRRRGGAGRGIAARNPRTGGIMSKQQMIDQVSSDIYQYAMMITMAWAAVDPCGEAMLGDVNVPGRGPMPRIEAFTERIVAMISRNNKMLESMAKRGIIADFVALGALAMPVIKVVMQAHGPGGTGHGEEHDADADLGAYPAFR